MCTKVMYKLRVHAHYHESDKNQDQGQVRIVEWVVEDSTRSEHYLTKVDRHYTNASITWGKKDMSQVHFFYLCNSMTCRAICGISV